MRTSNLPKNLVALFSVFLFASFFISGCTSTKIATTNLPEERSRSADFVININTADAAELQRLPHVGPALAERIIDHRTRYGPLRRPEHLLVIEGISEKRFGELRQFINTE